MDNINKVLTACTKQAHGGGNINVCDLMYETSLPYPELKEILDKLVICNELAVIDIKTYKFIGDINRRFEEVETKKPDAQAVYNSGIYDPFEARRAYLEERRRELIKRMRAEMQKDDDGNETDAEDGETCDKLAEYEKFLQEQTEDSDDSQEENVCDCKDGQMDELVVLLKTILREGREAKPWEDIPEHPSWADENDFMRFCAEQLTALLKSNKKTGRQGAVKKAKALLEDVQKIRNKELTEVYECIVFELINMSNYYYNKIRSQFT